MCCKGVQACSLRLFQQMGSANIRSVAQPNVFRAPACVCALRGKIGSPKSYQHGGQYVVEPEN